MRSRVFLAALCVALFSLPASAAPGWLVDRIIAVESGGRAHVTGSAGEIGLMQIKCRTARSVGFRGSCKALYQPGINRKYGIAYLSLAIRKARGNLRHAVSLYNRGVYSKFRGCSSYCRKVFRR